MDLSTEQQRERIRKLLESDYKPRTRADIASALGMEPNPVSKRLYEMEKLDMLQRTHDRPSKFWVERPDRVELPVKKAEVKTRIYWNGSEKHKLIQVAAERMFQNPLLKPIEALREVQKEVLDPSRQRELTTPNVTALKWFIEGVETEVSRMRRQERELEEEVTPEPAQEPEKKVQVTAEELSTAVLIEQLLAKVRTEFAGAIAEGIERGIKAAGMTFSQQEQPKEQTKEELPQPQPREEKKSVLIVGLLPSQAHEIRKGYSKEFDLRFAKSKDTPAVLKDKVKNVDQVLVMRFVGHGHTRAIEAAGKSYAMANSMTQLRERLDDLFLYGETKAAIMHH